MNNYNYINIYILMLDFIHALWIKLVIWDAQISRQFFYLLIPKRAMMKNLSSFLVNFTCIYFTIYLFMEFYSITTWVHINSVLIYLWQLTFPVHQCLLIYFTWHWYGHSSFHLLFSIYIFLFFHFQYSWGLSLFCKIKPVFSFLLFVTDLWLKQSI